MEIILELLRALAFAAVPVGLATFGMVYLALNKGYILPGDEGAKGIGAELKKMSRKDRKKLDKKKDFLHHNWLKFGGGFYGIVALVTYALVELEEIIDFFRNFESFSHFIDTIGIGLVINFFINSILNFVTAITWPIHWVSEIDTDQKILWLIIAYLGYLAGARLAHLFVARSSVLVATDSIEEDQESAESAVTESDTQS